MAGQPIRRQDQINRHRFALQVQQIKIGRFKHPPDVVGFQKMQMALRRRQDARGFVWRFTLKPCPAAFDRIDPTFLHRFEQVFEFVRWQG